MLQNQYMAPWVGGFVNTVDTALNAEGGPPYVACQLATVDSQGFPHVRTLVYRGFLFNDKANNVITLTTDKRLDKYQELLHNDKFEAVFWFPNARKQYRFRGIARIIDDEYKPLVDVSSINPRTIIERERLSASESDSDSDNDDDSGARLELKALHSPVSPPLRPLNNNSPISHSIISPSLASTLQQYKSANNLLYTNLHDLQSVDLRPPSDQEWDDEIARQWNGLSKKLKASFRKPTPKTKMDDVKQKKIDSIRRGVDGKKEESGLQNFALIALFTDYVDLYEDEKDRRYIYEKDSYQMWSENEVCP
jgi:pyridoxamine 5'-phosphate oxidase